MSSTSLRPPLPPRWGRAISCVLGPDAYTGEQLTLGGLFFNNPQGRLFFDPTKPDPPKFKSSARVYVLICRGITE